MSQFILCSLLFSLVIGNVFGRLGLNKTGGSSSSDESDWDTDSSDSDDAEYAKAAILQFRQQMQMEKQSNQIVQKPKENSIINQTKHIQNALDNLHPHADHLTHNVKKAIAAALVTVSTVSHSRQLEKKLESAGWYRSDKIEKNGSVGTVKRYTHKLTSERIAIKKVSGDDIAGIEEETTGYELAGNFNSRYCASYYGKATSSTGDLYIVMQDVAGGELADYIKQHYEINAGGPHIKKDTNQINGKVIFNKRPDLTQAESLAENLLTGLNAMHSKNIVHLDIKSENAMLEKVSDKLIAVWIDYGFATKVDRDGKFDGVGMDCKCGNDMAMAPELWDKTVSDSDWKRLDLKALDMWALGVLFFKLFTGVDFLVALMGAVDMSEYARVGRKEVSQTMRVLTDEKIENVLRLQIEKVWGTGSTNGPDRKITGLFKFLKTILRVNPKHRISAAEGVRVMHDGLALSFVTSFNLDRAFDAVATGPTVSPRIRGALPRQSSGSKGVLKESRLDGYRTNIDKARRESGGVGSGKHRRNGTA